jgi:5-formyltetrahydrofolate cyclo-ligase
MSEKIALRKTFIKTRENIPAPERAKMSARIKKRLFQLPEFKQAKTLMFYVSFKNEVDTTAMIKETLKTDRSVVLPVLPGQSNYMSSWQITDYDDDLEDGRYGIKQPKKERSKEIAADQIDLIILPALAFDLRGHRLGFGLGCYDRFLKRMSPSAIRIGLAYEAQIVGRLPKKSHDVAVHKIITERRAIECK